MRGLIIVVVSSIFWVSCQSSDTTDGTTLKDTSNIDSTVTNVATQYGYCMDSFNIDSNIVQSNQTVSHFLPDYGITFLDIHQMVEASEGIFDFKKIKADKKYYVISTNDSTHRPVSFIYLCDAIEYVQVTFGDSITVQRIQKPIDTLINMAGGVIESSLWNAFIDNGLSPALVSEYAKLYAWTIDFFGVQKGDFFKVIYEEKFVEGRSVGIGEVKALLFNHGGNDYYCLRYENDTLGGLGYFDEKGESMKKALLSAPLKYRRISSRFSHRRLHPIKRVYRPHHGVDYAAPTGTPVVATGDGTVTFAARAGGAGKMVKIKHNVGRILTKYLHLSKYGKGIRKGTKVKQGQVIGYVGNTGLSTGPHLDYRVYINGKAVDPLGIDIPTLDPIPADHMEQYLRVITPLKDQLDQIKLTPAQSKKDEELS